MAKFTIHRNRNISTVCIAKVQEVFVVSIFNDEVYNSKIAK